MIWCLDFLCVTALHFDAFGPTVQNITYYIELSVSDWSLNQFSPPASVINAQFKCNFTSSDYSLVLNMMTGLLLNLTTRYS
jgi:hypothetical protein